MVLEEIMADGNFFHHYQPIYDIQNNDIIGYEGLFRTKNHANPEDIFLTAKKNRQLFELDSRSVHQAFLTYINAGNSLRTKNLFLNVFPTTVTNPLFFTLIHNLIKENYISGQQITLEINENEIIDFAETKKAITHLKDVGVLIAIDDYGKGHASIKSVIEFCPDFVKLDKYLADGLAHSKKKQDIIEYLLHFCDKFNSQLIVEGIEDEQTLELLEDIGVRYVQGFLLGKPSLLS